MVAFVRLRLRLPKTLAMAEPSRPEKPKIPFEKISQAPKIYVESTIRTVHSCQVPKISSQYALIYVSATARK